MSTLFGGGGDASTGNPIQDREDLFRIFRGGEKPPERFGLGIEYERLPVCRDTGLAVPYSAPSGAPSIEAFLEALTSRAGWRDEREAGHIIALERKGTRVTLEPGAQVELSGRVHQHLDEARDEVLAFAKEADEAAASTGIAFLGLGFHPVSDVPDIGWVPKSRYKIMAPYLATRGHLAHAMMKGTAGCQVNLDYGSEADAMEKLRVAMGISSLVTALCANSPLSRGQANGFASKRSHIWMRTDPDRSGLLQFALRDGAGYADYVAYALAVPMMFVVRDGAWLNMTGRTFGAYLDGDRAGLTPTLADWELHLTTLFPEARLKAYVEVRGSDSTPPDAILAQAALWKGILYHEASRRRAWSMVADLSFEQRLAFARDVAREGLEARLGESSALELAQELVTLAAQGLPKDEVPHLQALRHVAFERRESPSATLLSRWSAEWQRDPRRLVASLAEPLAAPGGVGTD